MKYLVNIYAVMTKTLGFHSIPPLYI